MEEQMNLDMPKTEPQANEAPATDELRNSACGTCGEPITADQNAVVYPYAGVSYHGGKCEPSTPPAPIA